MRWQVPPVCVVAEYIGYSGSLLNMVSSWLNRSRPHNFALFLGRTQTHSLFLKYRSWDLSGPYKINIDNSEKKQLLWPEKIQYKYSNSDVRLMMPTWLIGQLIHSSIHLLIFHPYSNHLFKHLVNVYHVLGFIRAEKGIRQTLLKNI